MFVYLVLSTIFRGRVQIRKFSLGKLCPFLKVPQLMRPSNPYIHCLLSLWFNSFWQVNKQGLLSKN